MNIKQNYCIIRYPFHPNSSLRRLHKPGAAKTGRKFTPQLRHENFGRINEVIDFE